MLRISRIAIVLAAVSWAAFAQSCGEQGDGCCQGGPGFPSNPAILQQSTQTLHITVTDRGFFPSTVTLRAGQPARLIFTRNSDQTCATSVDLPNHRRIDLPLNKPVAVNMTPPVVGTYGFSCPMKMVNGSIVVR